LRGGIVGAAFALAACGGAVVTAGSTETASPTPTPTSTSTASPTSTSTSTPTATSTPAAPKRYRTVLSVGDSFNGAFSLALAKRFDADGTRFVRDVWVAVAISTFARSDRMSKLVAASDPDLVLVNLGANDVNSNDPESAAADIRAIVAKLDGRDCYWIAPALWKKDTGIIDVLAKSVAPCRFFDSKGFRVERGKDHWHPSVDGGAVWADEFWKFFGESRSVSEP
jgi:acyl-CoA thioesterase-1